MEALEEKLTIQLRNITLVKSGRDARKVDNVEQRVNVGFYVVHNR